MEITGLPQLNLITGYCGCCPLPECGPPTVKCQSISFRSDCADDDYTDAVDRYNLHEAWIIEHDAWVIDHAAWEVEHAAWVIEHDAWLACEEISPGECDEEPEEPEEPLEPEEPVDEPEPEKPEGYDDYDHGCYAPFTEPAVSPQDEVPRLYGQRKGIAQPTVTGTTWAYFATEYGFPAYAFSESLKFDTFSAWWVDGSGSVVEEESGNLLDEIAGTCDPFLGTPPNYVGPNGGTGEGESYPDEGEVTDICTETERGTETLYILSEGSPTPTIALIGCGGLGEESFVPFEYRGFHLELTDEIKDVLSSPKTKLTLIERAIDNLPSWPLRPPGTSCVAATVAEWPIVSDFYIEADPEADPPVAAEWEPHCEISSGYADVPETYALVNKARYRMGVPESYMAHRLWVEAHEEWVHDHAVWAAADPETRGDEPVEPEEPPIYNYFAVQWDVVRFPALWEMWRELWLEYTAALALHEIWEDADPGTRGPEPEVPSNPGNQPPDQPEFIEENLFWEWTGGETEAEQYEAVWHYLDPPPTYEGETRVVNRQTKCYKSIRLGVPPTPVGEVYNPDDYPSPP